MPHLLRAHPAFRRLWAAGAISLVGDWLSFVAVSALALEMGAGALGLALVFAAHALPAAILSPFAGALLDRMDRRRVLVGADAVAGVVTAAMAGAAVLGWVWVVQALLLVRSAVTSIVPPGESAAVRRLVPAAALLPANSLLAATWSVAYVAGMSLGGAAAMLGPALALALDAATFATAAVLHATLPAMPAPPQNRAVTSPLALVRTTPRDTAAALRIAARRRPLLAAVLGKTPFGFAGGAGWIALNLVGALAQPFGPAALSFGILQAIRGAGTGIGPAVAAALARRGVAERSLTWATRALMVVGIGGLVIARTPTGLAAAALAWGLGTGTNWVLSHAAMQRESPDEVIGRLAAFDELMVTLAMVLSAFAGAAAVGLAGITGAALTGIALGAFGLAAVAAVVRRASAVGSGVGERQLAEVVALPEVDAVVAQDPVRGRQVEVEVGQDEVVEVVAAAQ